MQKNLQLVSQLFGTFTLKCIPAFFFAVSCLVHISKKKLHLHMYAFSRLYHPLLLYHPAKNVICARVQKENICFENKLLLLGNPDGDLTTQKCMEENTPQCLICIDSSSPVVHRDKEQIQ